MSYHPSKLKEIRKVLKVPEGYRIGQYIYNAFEGRDIFNISDEDFAKKFEDKK